MIEIAEPPFEAIIVQSLDNMRSYYSSDEQIICASADGITPSDKSSEPQSKQCAACPKNSWGSRITPNGKRAKACTEYATLKVLVLSDLLPSYALLRVPSTSLRSFRDYKKSLSTRGYSPKRVVTYISTVPQENFDLITFKIVRFLKGDELSSIKTLTHSRPRFEKTDGYIY